MCKVPYNVMFWKISLLPHSRNWGGGGGDLKKKKLKIGILRAEEWMVLIKNPFLGKDMVGDR